MPKFPRAQAARLNPGPKIAYIYLKQFPLDSQATHHFVLRVVVKLLKSNLLFSAMRG
jgi:hypothetical protein